MGNNKSHFASLYSTGVDLVYFTQTILAVDASIILPQMEAISMCPYIRVTENAKENQNILNKIIHK